MDGFKNVFKFLFFTLRLENLGDRLLPVVSSAQVLRSLADFCDRLEFMVESIISNLRKWMLL